MMKRKIIALQFSSMIIGIIAIVSFITLYNLLESFKLVNHTYDVIYQLHRVKDDVTDCQTSVREAVFADNPSFINLYLDKSPGIEKEIDTLQWLTRDNTLQQKNVYEFRQNINRRLAVFREVYDLYKLDKKEEARTLLKVKFGESWIQTTRNLAEIIESEERRLLDLRQHDYKYKSNMIMYGLPLLIMLHIVFFSVSARNSPELT